MRRADIGWVIVCGMLLLMVIMLQGENIKLHRENVLLRTTMEDTVEALQSFLNKTPTPRAPEKVRVE
jgi:hypothetical protein